MSETMKKHDLVPGYSISPVIKGGWQLSEGHSLSSTISSNSAVRDTVAFIESGISTLDFGDIYSGVEELIGRAMSELRRVHGESSRGLVQLHTKYVPNDASLDNFDKSDVERIVNRSRQRLGVDTIDLVQFHWWKYESRSYLVAMSELFRLKSEGKIRHIGVTNFDVERLAEMVDAELKPASIQIQYSLLDRRPEAGMLEYCEQNGIGVLCYGTVAGGYLSEKYLNCIAPSEAETRSNLKYRLVIDEFGGWDLFQLLLTRLHEIAKRQSSDIATIASAYILQRSPVKGVIVGARNVLHLDSNLQIPLIKFSQMDLVAINEVIALATGPNGPVYHLERYSDAHRKIMHTNLN
jgi:aryl-alcohol dehydrogenase-like predicted oxidoreductase